MANFKTKRRMYLANAKKQKIDEFYTQLSDIEKELKYYKKHFKDKIVYCNCDDPRESNFFRYFFDNFKKLGLKKLIASCYKDQNLELFEQNNNNNKQSVYVEYSGENHINTFPNIKEIKIKYLKGDGDFRSLECIDLLKQSDIVVTNPPFSLFREYINQLVEYNKKFIIMGPQNAISYKKVFELIKENKIKLGITIKGGAICFINKKNTQMDEHDKKIKVSGIVWFTNLDISKKNKNLVLDKKYDPQKYPKYENYDAINVDKTKDIPMDYSGEMGVPISFLNKYNPEQFEIIALGRVGTIQFTNNRKMEILDKNGNPTGKFTYNAKGTLYRLYDPKKDKAPAFKDYETGKLYSSIFARIIIKNKKPK